MISFFAYSDFYNSASMIITLANWKIEILFDQFSVISMINFTICLNIYLWMKLLGSSKGKLS